MLPRWIAWAALVVPAACGTFKPKVMADGSYRLQCASTHAQCVKRAQQWCGDDEFILLEQSDPQVYGVEGHQVGTEGALVIFRCGEPERDEWKLPARRQPPAASAAPSVAASAVPSAAPSATAPRAGPEPACVPGATQRCYGPGACEGAQVCLPDGSGYGPCDCGSGPPDAGVDGGRDAAVAPDAD